MNMKQIELVESEVRISQEELFKIHLYLEGDWWRAYEWSAYLCEHYPNDLDKSQHLKATHRHLKGVDDGIISVGLKLGSFEKYLPNITRNEELIQIDDKHMILDVSEEYMNIINFEDYTHIFNDWKSSIPYKDKDNLTKSTKQIFNTPNISSLTAVMQQVLGYPLEKKTMVDNTLFISYLKEELSKLI